MDLPKHWRNEGSVSYILEECSAYVDPVYWVRIEFKYNGSTISPQNGVFCRGDYRPDVVEVVKGLTAYKGQEFPLPEGWEEKVLQYEGLRMKIKLDWATIEAGAMDMKRVAEISKNGSVKNPRYDDPKSFRKNLVLDRDEFLTEFRGSVADQLVNNRFGRPSEMMVPPTDEELAGMIAEAGQVYDRYQSFPVGSMVVTKDFIFPYVLGRKKHPELRIPPRERYGTSWKGSFLRTADKCAHLTGIDKDYAPHMYANPVLTANFGFAMDITNDTVLVAPDNERDYIEEAVNSLGQFKTIVVQNPPALPSDVTPISRNYWHPTKDELIRVIGEHLEVH